MSITPHSEVLHNFWRLVSENCFAAYRGYLGSRKLSVHLVNELNFLCPNTGNITIPHILTFHIKSEFIINIKGLLYLLLNV
jgi:hypothetical protein